MENPAPDHLSEMDLQLDGEVRQQLYTAAKWARFISVIVFIGCAIMLIFGVAGGAAIINAFQRLGTFSDLFGGFGGTLFVVIIVLVVAVVVFVYYFLFHFAAKIKNALLGESTAELNAGLKSLRIFFIITTVFAMLSLLNTIVNMFK